VVVPGGVAGPLACPAASALSELNALDEAVASDVRALMTTASFLDRLRSTGVLPPAAAAEHGALGPVGRGSGLAEDVRVSRPYGSYPLLGFDAAPPSDDGDALARQQVRVDEIGQSFHLVRQALDELNEHDETGAPNRDGVPPGEIRRPGGAGRSSTTFGGRVDGVLVGDAGRNPVPGGTGSLWRCEMPDTHGSAVGWVEAPQGELLYSVEVDHGRLVRVKPRSASFHNLALLASAFRGDIFTDFAFIEASYGLSVAGAAG